MADQKLTESLDRLQQTLKQHVENTLENINGQIETIKTYEPETVQTGMDGATFLNYVKSFEGASTQVELLNLLVKTVGELVPRVLLLIRKADAVHGWSGCGFTPEFAASRLKRVKWGIQAYPELREVLSTSTPKAVNFSDLSEISDQISQFDGFVPLKACFFPIKVKGKVAAILYVDSGSDSQLTHRDWAETLAYLAGTELTLVTSKIKTKSAEPKPAPPEPPAKVEAPPTPTSAPQPVATLPPVAPVAPVNFEAPKPVSFEAPAPEPDFSAPAPSFEPDPAPSFDDGSNFAAPKADFSDSPTAPVSKPSPPAAEETPSIKKARRVARVLVSDLKLYNEDAVKVSIANHDLYARLRDDIDRSFKHYEERVSSLTPPPTENYFKEELIRQLGEGNPDTIGPLPF